MITNWLNSSLLSCVYNLFSTSSLYVTSLSCHDPFSCPFILPPPFFMEWRPLVPLEHSCQVLKLPGQQDPPPGWLWLSAFSPAPTGWALQVTVGCQHSEMSPPYNDCFNPSRLLRSLALPPICPHLLFHLLYTTWPSEELGAIRWELCHPPTPKGANLPPAPSRWQKGGATAPPICFLLTSQKPHTH